MNEIIVRPTMKKTVVWVVRMRDLFADYPHLFEEGRKLNLDRPTVVKSIIGLADLFLGQCDVPGYRMCRHLLPTQHVDKREEFYNKVLELAWKLVDLAPDNTAEMFYITTTHGTIYIHVIIAELSNDGRP